MVNSTFFLNDSAGKLMFRLIFSKPIAKQKQQPIKIGLGEILKIISKPNININFLKIAGLAFLLTHVSTFTFILFP